jgi:hypothetical protein
LKLVPPGYVLDEKTGRLEVDQAQRQTIAAMLEVLGKRSAGKSDPHGDRQARREDAACGR